MKNASIAAAFLLAGSLVLGGCAGASQPAQDGSKQAIEQTGDQKAQPIDYMALVNKQHALPDGWENSLETVRFKNSVGNEVEVEKKAYDAYLALKSGLEKEGVRVDLDSARRSVAEQQEIMDEFTKEYGADYAKKTVATPGYSEHHTGLALDLYLNIDGKDITENEEMMKHPEVWEKIHAKLAEHGFILRYLKGVEHITGYGYEPWHIRYIDNPEIAKEITDKGITFEEHLAGKTLPAVAYDYGTSTLYTPEELEEAAVQVKCQFANFAGCELHSLRYAGDEANTPENLKRLNEINGADKKTDYTQVVEILTDFHTPAQASDKFEADKEMKDYKWWLARKPGEGWQLITWEE